MDEDSPGERSDRDDVDGAAPTQPLDDTAIGAGGDPAAATPARLGPYRLVRELGRGGMGRVYLAERADAEFEKLVAVKIISAEAARAEFVGRFRRERQILARLEHTGIARLLDGGATRDGRPYFVMEYVDGLPLDRYCVRNRLPVRERLGVFRQVCEAVQYAHRRLIVHRDLKPRNILVTAEGVPKLLDFGIAKLLDAEDRAPSDTATGFAPFTPDFASPEQVRGDPITTATDIYALGVVLYLLLTGHLPYRSRRRSAITSA